MSFPVVFDRAGRARVPDASPAAADAVVAQHDVAVLPDDRAR